MRIAVFASGGGTDLQSLLDACRGDAPGHVTLVVSNRADAGALERAKKAQVEAHVMPDHTDGPAIVELLQARAIDLVVLAGYLKLVPEEVVNAFEGRMLNIHPALLPAFGGAGMYGMRVHRAVIEAGNTLSGPTVHLVTAEYDKGPIVAQWPVPVAPDDTPESLQQRVLAVEHQLLPAVVLAAARAGRVTRLLPDGDAFTIGDDSESVARSLTSATTRDQTEEE